MTSKNPQISKNKPAKQHRLWTYVTTLIGCQLIWLLYLSSCREKTFKPNWKWRRLYIPLVSHDYSAAIVAWSRRGDTSTASNLAMGLRSFILTLEVAAHQLQIYKHLWEIMDRSDLFVAKLMKRGCCGETYISPYSILFKSSF